MLLIRIWFTFLAGAMKGCEPDSTPTPATEISSSPVESAKKLDSLVQAAPRCSSQKEKSNKQKQEAWDVETGDAFSINQEDLTEKIDITKIMHSMKRGKCSARQRVKSSAPWAHRLGF